MFDTAYYLHYVLDNKNDDHFTDDLLQLPPEAYLWHELKECHDFDCVVFVEGEKDTLTLEVFDSKSEQLLRPAKKSFFSISKRNEPDIIRRASFSPTELGQSSVQMLNWLLELQKSTKKRKTAVVCSFEALKILYQKSIGLGRDALCNLARGKHSAAIMVVRLDTDAAQLRQAFCCETSCLADIDPSVRAVLDINAQLPLLEVLSEQLQDRLVDLSGGYSEIENMMLHDALTGCPDCMDRIRDQASYLELCCRTGLGLGNFPLGDGPIRRDRIYGRLSAGDFRSALRRETESLRRHDSEISMEELFCREYGVCPDACGTGICVEDDLTKTLKALVLPEAYLTGHPLDAAVPQRLLKAASTLWNKAQNEYVYQKMKQFCDNARTASAAGDWDTLSDALVLLKLCAEYICADSDKENQMYEIFVDGETLIKFSSDYYHETRKFREMYPSNSPQSYCMSLEAEMAVRLTAEQELEVKQAKLNTLRSALNGKILSFGKEPLGKHVEEILDEFVPTIQEKLDKSYADMQKYGKYGCPDDDRQDPYDL